MHEILFTKCAENQLKKLERNIQARILSVLERVRIRPSAYFTRLVGDKAYKLRIGDYRILADIDNSQLIILVLEVGHRRNIYK